MSSRAGHPLVVAAALLLIGLAPRAAEACVCMGTFSGNPPCQARWQAGAVFVGRVVSIEPATWSQNYGGGLPPFQMQGARIRINVSEAFAGVKTGDVELRGHASTCDYQFEQGRQYLVYAGTSSDGSMTAIVCSRTRKIEDAAEDLAYLRTIPATLPRDGRIIGVAMHFEPSQSDDREPSKPFAGARIIAEGQGLRRTATTGRDGRYELRVPAGKYHVRAEAAAGMYTSEFTTDEVDLKDARGCTVADFTVSFDGHVAGRVVTNAGEPVPYLPVELTPVAPDGAWPEAVGWTDANGRIQLNHVPPGRFMLSFHAERGLEPAPGLTQVFLPGTVRRAEARVITVEPSGTVAVGNFVIPETMHFHALTGVVNDQGGKPIEGARVYLMTDAVEPRPVGSSLITRADGRFAFAVLDGQRYQLHVEAYTPPGGLATAELTGILASAGIKPIVIVPMRK